MSYLDKFHYQLSGNPRGDKLVFLHGLMGSAANWRRITPAFEADYHILTYDQRGHGRSFHPDRGYHPRDYAQDLLHILDELGWNSSALVGHSMGGRNSVEFASRFSQRVKALVLEDIGPDANFEAITRIERLLRSVPTPFASRLEAKSFFENEYPDKIAFYPQPQVVSRFLLSNIEARPDGTQDWRFAKDAILQSMREGRNEDHWDAFCNLKMPVLVIRGENSKDLTPEVYERMLKVRPATQGRVVPQAGHWVHFDQPEVFIQIVKEFLTCSGDSVY